MTDSCVERIMNWTGVGAVVGTFYGSVLSVWDSPRLTAEQLPSIKQQARLIGRNSVFLAAAGAAYASGECLAESVRNCDDVFNPMVGGVMAGAIAGLEGNSITKGVRGAAIMAAGMAFFKFMKSDDLSPKEKWELSRKKYQTASE